MRILFGVSSSKIFHVQELVNALEKLQIQCKLVFDQDYANGYPSRKMENWISSNQKFKKLVDELTKLDIPRLRGTHIIKIADLIPETVDDIKVILQGYALTVTTDNMKKIVGVTSKFASK